MKKILFVCSGNTCRSPMAETIFNSLMEQQNHKEPVWTAASAGLFAQDDFKASYEASWIMEEMGLDLSAHRSRKLCEQLLEEIDLILTMTEKHKKHLIDKFPQVAGKVFMLTEFVNEYGDVSDPFGGGYQVYSETGRYLQELITKLLSFLPDF